jgi:hypothetical protein
VCLVYVNTQCVMGNQSGTQRAAHVLNSACGATLGGEGTVNSDELRGGNNALPMVPDCRLMLCAAFRPSIGLEQPLSELAS